MMVAPVQATTATGTAAHDPLCRYQELDHWTHDDHPDRCTRPHCVLHIHVTPAIDCTCADIAIIRADQVTRTIAAIHALPAHPSSYSTGDGALMPRADVITAIAGTAHHAPRTY